MSARLLPRLLFSGRVGVDIVVFIHRLIWSALFVEVC